MNTMKIKNVCLLATFLAIGWLFAACSSDSEDVVTQEELVLGDIIKAQFSVSIPMQTNGGSTRMSGDAVQSAENIEKFRGINKIKMFPSAVTPAVFNTSSLIGKNITLTNVLIPYMSTGVDNYIPEKNLLKESKSVVYGDVQLQIGTRTFLFYGKAIGLGKEPDEVLTEYTPQDYFKNGHLDVTGMGDANDPPTNVSGFTFSPKSITTATKSDAKRLAICKYLNSIAAAKVTTTDAGVEKVVEEWSKSENKGYKKLYDS
ncbi:MAG: hypothetical protein II706_01560, partial [Bacteroidaceae bacterium]|nr:hypothetical protein [Bacteroidaceae bacterium]